MFVAQRGSFCPLFAASISVIPGGTQTVKGILLRLAGRIMMIRVVLPVAG
jgi:hypothetical protein